MALCSPFRKSSAARGTCKTTAPARSVTARPAPYLRPLGASAGLNGEILLTDGGKLKVPAAEPVFLGKDYDPQAPRAFTRYTLFGQAGARVMAGHVYSDYYNFSLPLLHVQSPEEKPGRSEAYPGLIECFRGESALASKEMLAVEPNETDALRAVAVRVKTRDGRGDASASPTAARTGRVPCPACASPGRWLSFRVMPGDCLWRTSCAEPGLRRPAWSSSRPGPPMPAAFWK